MSGHAGVHTRDSTHWGKIPYPCTASVTKHPRTPMSTYQRPRLTEEVRTTFIATVRGRDIITHHHHKCQDLL